MRAARSHVCPVAGRESLSVDSVGVGPERQQCGDRFHRPGAGRMHQGRYPEHLAPRIDRYAGVDQELVYLGVFRFGCRDEGIYPPDGGPHFREQVR